MIAVPAIKAAPLLVSMIGAGGGVIYAAEVDAAQGVAAAMTAGIAIAGALYKLVEGSKAETLVRETLRARIDEVEADRDAERDRHATELAARDAEIRHLREQLDRYRFPYPTPGDPT